MKTENKNLNIPNITVDTVVSVLSRLYSSAVQRRTPFVEIPTPFLWGAAGVGKSQAVRQIANEIGAKTGKRVDITDVRLLLFSPVDLRGIPTANAEKTLAVWLKPQIFQMDEGENTVNILFLDELSAAPQSVQAAAYQICLDRKVGEHTLPDNCIVIAAGNRTTDQSVSYKMPKALCNRLMHFNVETDFVSWRRWAVANGIDERIIGYLAFDNSKLCVEPESSETAYPTPRSWEFVSNLLKTVGDDTETARQLISACVGNDTAVEFEAWVGSRAQLPKAEDILNGRCRQYPATQDALLTLISSLVSAVRKRKPITVQELENVCAYAKKFPADFAFTLYTDLKATEDIRLKLAKCPSHQEWLTKNKHLF